MESISKNEQIAALLSGSIIDVIAGRLGKPVVDIRPYLTITRSDIENFLRENPREAERYFKEKAHRPASPDTDVIGFSGGLYRVAWRDHNRNRFEKTFASIPEAVAEHILIMYGMY